MKLRGFRIEPGEIESVLRLHPGVRDAAVIARGDAPDERKLAAYLVTASGGEIPVTELRKHLQARLPDYMVPAAFVFLDALPLNTSGKVDRRALPAPGHRDEAREHAAPRTELETLLCTLWQEVLKIGRVGIHDNFFEAGGDSLSAMKVITRLRGTRFPDVNAGLMFEHPTVATLAGALEASDAGEREEGVL